MSEKKTRVLIVDDSYIFTQSLTYLLSNDPSISVVGVATNGSQALTMVKELAPDIITLDIHMPVMSGLDAIEQIMAHHPTPILVLSDDRSERMAFESLERGALDILPKPQVFPGNAEDEKKFIEHLKFLSGIQVVRHMAGAHRRTPRFEPEVAYSTDPIVIAVACSTGGPKALKSILGSLPRTFPACLLIVQHMSLGFCQGFADWLNSTCPMRISVAADGDIIEPGVALIAPDNAHLMASNSNRVFLSKEPESDGHRPSANLLFSSVAKRYRNRAVGVVLTGMGSDGSKGAAEIQSMGGITIAQDEKSSLVFGMPGAAIKIGAITYVLGIESIAKKLTEITDGI